MNNLQQYPKKTTDKLSVAFVNRTIVDYSLLIIHYSLINS